MNLIVFGLSHRTLPVRLREKAALPDAGARALLRDVAASGAVSEAVALSTCNRTEVYARTADPAAAERAVARALVARSRIGAAELAAGRYLLRDDRAVTQLFRVACSLDSMVIGESEIQGQVHGAWELAAAEGATGPVLNRLFHQALEVGKEVRSSTRIGAGAVSVSAVAVDLARLTLGDLAHRRVMVIGAGQVAEAAARSLVAKGAGSIVVANRTLRAATELAAHVGGRGVGLDALPAEMGAADIVISSTDAPGVVLGPDAARRAVAARAASAAGPMVIIDTSVPRDVDPAVGTLAGVTLFDIDDLARTAEANLNGRRAEAEVGERYVLAAAERFAAWRRGRTADAVISALRAHAEDIRRAELERAGRSPGWAAGDHERLDRLTAAIINKLLHEPTVRVRAEAERGEGTCLADGARRLFGLADPADA